MSTSKPSVDVIRQKFELLKPMLNERMRRFWAAAEAQGYGWGGITAVSTATGLSQTTIRAGIAELTQPATESASSAALPAGRIRRQGGGCRSLIEQDPDLLTNLELLVEPLTRGDPESPLRWTCKSTGKLAAELQAQGHRVSASKVSELLHALGYSLQANRKTREGSSHPDRDAQFEYINGRIQSFQAESQPVISVDCKKKELLGDFKNSGREWQLKGQPEKVRVHDFMDKELGKAIPYGVYDLTTNSGWVSVGVDHDTASFAVETVRRWWQQMGKPLYPQAQELLIVADSGGSNSARSRLWKIELQQLANETGLRIAVSHLPPGTSKWNKIEHRMFSYITLNWRGRPLLSHEVIVSLIGSTTTQTGLRIRAEMDANHYPTGQKVSDAELAVVQLQREAFHGEWNYVILPRTSSPQLPPT
jgi:transposase